MPPTLIYCGGGNPRFYALAQAAGFRYGARLPDTTYGPLYFADQEYKAPNRTAYMRALQATRPALATVRDIEQPGHLAEALSWAEEVAEFVQEAIILIPKCKGIIEQLPRTIGGRPVRLGYSIPTSYGGCPLPYAAFDGWDVHLLGGAPQVQMRLRGYLHVVSADSNYWQRMALGNHVWVDAPRFWPGGRVPRGSGIKDKWWPRLAALGDYQRQDALYEAFRRSCANIMAAWHAAPALL